MDVAPHGSDVTQLGTTQTMAAEGQREWTARWRARPVLAYVVLVVALLGPLAVGAATTWALAHHVRRPAGGWALAGWFTLVIGAPSVVLMVASRAARRLLPVAALLRLSLVFPDQAPRRFSLALRAGTTRRLRRGLAEAHATAADDDPAAAARRVLELLAALGDHDRLTRGHCERVRALNDLLAAEMGLSAEDQDRLRWAALLHDIGKLKVPRGILTKASKPTSSEWERLRQHPVEGARLTVGLRPWLGPWADSIPQHHERWDGAGYPDGLSGTGICLGARIVAVADTFEVMTARRPYQRPVSPDAARRELARCAGSQFDPAVVRAFLNVSIGDLHRALGALSWLAELPFLAGAPHLEGVAAVAGRTVATLSVSTALATGMAPSSPRSSTVAAPPGNSALSSRSLAPTPTAVAPHVTAPSVAPGGEATPALTPSPATPAALTTPPVPTPASPAGPQSTVVGATEAGVAAVGTTASVVAAATLSPVAATPTLPATSTVVTVPLAPVVSSVPPVVTTLPPPPIASPPLPGPAPAPPSAPAPAPSGGGLLSGVLGVVRRTLGI